MGREFGRLLFGIEILWNKLMDRQKREWKVQIWTHLPSLWEKLPSKLWLRKSLWTFSKFWLQWHNVWSEAENWFLIGLGLNLQWRFQVFIPIFKFLSIEKRDMNMAFVFNLSLLVFIFDVWILKVIFTVCLIKLGIGVIFINLFSYKLRFHPCFIRHSA